MTLQGLSIKKLFGQFDYDISLVNQDGIVILTGPNGYGKTTVLNIIYNLFKTNFYFFRKLNFENLDFYFSNNRKINLSKKIKEQNVQTIQIIDGQRQLVVQKQSVIDIYLTLHTDNGVSEIFSFNSDIENKFLQELTRLYRVRKISFNTLADLNTGVQIEIEDFLQQIPEKLLSIASRFYKKDACIQLFNLLLSTTVHLIKEQRLLKPVNILERINQPVNVKQSFSHTIQNYSFELRNLIGQRQAEAFQESQKLDNSFPIRLMQAANKLSIDEFNTKFQVLTEKQKRLQQFGITISNAETPEYNADKADVLSVYLDDSEKKTAFFDDLVKKIDIFVTTLNNKHLAYKNIKINGSKAVYGFSFVMTDGQSINLINLSSGEQEEIVLLYELLFKTDQNAFVLIDEPEISLHVMWQKEFVKDLLEIAKLKNISFCLATHSPQIINGRWDLVTDLYTLINKKGNPDFEEDDDK
jgi:predicted ATP-binding protein involved in virulence